MSRRNFALSLVLALFLSTLALANSIPVNMTFLHSGTSIHGVALTYASHSSISGGRATPMNYDAVNRHALNDWTHVNGLTSGKISLGNGTANFKTAHFNYHYEVGSHFVWQQTSGAPMPEPGSLVLLSTGLLGVAGMVRRKLLRG
ncbi:MAG: PEP-CTERM sorting domain-containing protein [Terriglobales bacterium]|jgi:hypothetical protein